MNLPGLYEGGKSRDMSIEFRGYNHNLYLSPNQFYDMRNMSGADYPVLAPRPPRALIRRLARPNGLFAKEALAWVDGADLYYDGEIVGQVTDSPKRFTGMGAYLIVWPDMAYYNTYTKEFGALGDEYGAAGEVTYTLARADGTDYGDYQASDTPPQSPIDGQLWVDTSGAADSLKQYSAASGVWTEIVSVFVKIMSAGIGGRFALYDGVNISGSSIEELNGSNVIYGIGEDYIIVTGVIERTTADGPGLHVSRDIPEMDHVVESGNRLWGCSSVNREVYACKLGDPKNWNSFQGIASDSYAASIGSDGEFTGAYALGGRVYFFKEETVHMVYGDRPSNYQIKETRTQGVASGSAGSIALGGGVLMYLSRAGVCAFDGESASVVSRDLGASRAFDSACAGVLGGKYYISMRDAGGGYGLYVYDRALSMWHREDDTQAAYLTPFMGELYFIDARDGGLYSASAGGLASKYADPDTARPEGPVSWMAETGDIGADSPDHKYVSKLQLRLSVDEGARVELAVRYDSRGPWRARGQVLSTGSRIVTIPIIPMRASALRIRISGEGGARIHSLSKIVEQGSEI